MLGLRYCQVRAISRWARRPSLSPPTSNEFGSCIRSFTASSPLYRKQEQNEHDEIKPLEGPTVRSKARQTLRSVGLAAAKKRQIIQDKGGLRIIDPDIETKKVTAYCAAEQYNIATAARLVEADGFTLDPYNTGLFPQVVHIQTPIYAPTSQQQPQPPTEREHGDLFIFPSGTVVAWNVPERVALRLVERVLPPAALNSQIGSVELEKEDLEYLEAPEQERSSIVGDTIILGTKSESLSRQKLFSKSNEPASTDVEADEYPEKDTILAKIAFSSGLARSTKLAVLERLTEAYVVSTRSIPTIMSRGTPLPFNRPIFLRKICEKLGFGSRLPFSRPFILRKTGELLSIRAQLNLYSELTDSLPDLFWDSRHELGLENYYELTGKALDVNVRIKVLNEKLGYAQEIASVLRETLSERHDLRLEWIIILLIAIEVVFEFGKIIKEWNERRDSENLEELARRWLKENVKSEK
ncbi:uncharacterized protein PV09_05968 [Verruconis gallopava]|uniref:DUF155 domain-containing protein n=1 Tax=Verruconis gallopava TaxID=253628 RepID=A0A0D1YQR7_9PEZI|nr:uncharacterized protein PV09_05968 [Verruconis gallopava]KIW02922.1 hypothetical protein PV09_05968 [Verruconis gallopava]